VEKHRPPKFKSIKDVPAGFKGKADIGGVPHVFSGKSMRSKSPEQAARRKKLHQETEAFNKRHIRSFGPKKPPR